MIHPLTAETLALLEAYYADRGLRQAVMEVRRRSASHKIRPATRSARRQPVRREPTPVSAADFSDAESQEVLRAAACSVARELGRQAARECFEAAIEKRKVG